MSGRGVRRVLDLVVEPRLVGRAVSRRWPGRSFEQRLAWDAVDRPHYAYCTYQAARQARALGIDAISAVELGVAGGNGLVALEAVAAAVERATGVRVATFGFDAGGGMPVPVDYRDLPYVWQPGFFPMDVAALEARLTRSRLILGDVAATVPGFVAEGGFPPLGFVAYDLDYWSSTMAAFALLDAVPDLRLPRVLCYFDDVIGDDWEMHSPFAGELLAIEEYNAAHDRAKLSPVNGLRHKRRVPAPWNDQVYVAHDFAHPLYERHVHPSDWDLGLAVNGRQRSPGRPAPARPSVPR